MYTCLWASGLGLRAMQRVGAKALLLWASAVGVPLSATSKAGCVSLSHTLLSSTSAFGSDPQVGPKLELPIKSILFCKKGQASPISRLQECRTLESDFRLPPSQTKPLVLFFLLISPP